MTVFIVVGPLIVFGIFCIYTAAVTYAHRQPSTIVQSIPLTVAIAEHRHALAAERASSQRVTRALERAVPLLAAAMRHSSASDLGAQAELLAEARMALDEREARETGQKLSRNYNVLITDALEPDDGES